MPPSATPWGPREQGMQPGCDVDGRRRMPIERGECHVLRRRRREIITVGLNSSFSYSTAVMPPESVDKPSCFNDSRDSFTRRRRRGNHVPSIGAEREGREGGTIDGVHTVHSYYLLLVHFSCLLNLSRLIRSASPLHGAMKRGREGASLWIIGSAATSSRGLLPFLSY